MIFEEEVAGLRCRLNNHSERYVNTLDKNSILTSH